MLSFPYPLRFLFATRPAVLTQVLGIVYRAIATFLIHRAGLRVGAGARTGAVTLIQLIRLGAEPGETVTVPSLYKSLIGFKQARLFT